MSKSSFSPTSLRLGLAARESGDVRLGDSVVVFAQGPIGLCATAGAKLMGASLIIAVESDPTRTAMAHEMGADVVLNQKEVDVISEVKRLTDGGADVAIEALGLQETFENALRCLRPAARSAAWEFIRGNFKFPTMRSLPALAITRL